MIILRQKEYGIIANLGRLTGKAILGGGNVIRKIGKGIMRVGLGGAAIHPVGLGLATLGAGLLAYRHYKKRKAEGEI